MRWKPELSKEASSLIDMKTAEREPTPPILTLAEVAGFLRCSKAQACNLMNGRVAGVPPLATVRIGRRKLVRRQSLIAWIEARESEVSGMTKGAA